MSVELYDELARLCNRVGRTYHAHLAMAKRLQRRERYWTAALIVISCVSTVSAVALLTAPQLYGGRGGTLWALIGVVTLAVSLVVANADYRVRANVAFADYRKLQKLWSALNLIATTRRSARIRTREAQAGDLAYQVILDNIPNHTSADFFSVVIIHRANDNQFDEKIWSHYRATRPEMIAIRGARVSSAALTYLPLLMAAAASVMLLPVIEWLVDGA